MAHTKTTWGGAVSMSLFYDLVWDIQTERYSNLQSLAYCSHDSHSGTANHSPNLSIPSSTSVVLISSGIYLWTLKLFHKHPKQNAASSFGNSNKTHYWKLARTFTRLDIHKLWVNRPSLGSLHRVRFRNLTPEKHLEDSYTKEKLKTDDDIVNPQDELYSMAREVGSNPSVSDHPETKPWSCDDWTQRKSRTSGRWRDFLLNAQKCIRLVGWYKKVRCTLKSILCECAKKWNTNIYRHVFRKWWYVKFMSWLSFTKPHSFNCIYRNHYPADQIEEAIT